MLFENINTFRCTWSLALYQNSSSLFGPHSPQCCENWKHDCIPLYVPDDSWAFRALGGACSLRGRAFVDERYRLRSFFALAFLVFGDKKKMYKRFSSFNNLSYITTFNHAFPCWKIARLSFVTTFIIGKHEVIDPHESHDCGFFSWFDKVLKFWWNQRKWVSEYPRNHIIFLSAQCIKCFRRELKFSNNNLLTK